MTRTTQSLTKFLLAAGQGSGKMAVYRIDDQTGRLAPLEVYAVGQTPMWILVLDLSGGAT